MKNQLTNPVFTFMSQSSLEMFTDILDYQGLHYEVSFAENGDKTVQVCATLRLQTVNDIFDGMDNLIDAYEQFDSAKADLDDNLSELQRAMRRGADIDEQIGIMRDIIDAHEEYESRKEEYDNTLDGLKRARWHVVEQ